MIRYLRKYANAPSGHPRIQRVAGQVTLKHLVLVYSGWELIYRAEAGAVRSLTTLTTQLPPRKRAKRQSPPAL